ncbi:hypothetical protein LIER_27350 [Lithospermum erythrorhizon]|uniref:Uncharacterized protein n=1 Tax=Lithospermum erythrorhizon TaxID=34254 RepID=A0AAV3RF42_LITER
MAALVMSLDNMIQNNRCNSVRGVDGGRGMRGVRGPRGTFRGDGRLAGPPRRGPLSMYGPGGTSRVLEDWLGLLGQVVWACTVSEAHLEVLDDWLDLVEVHWALMQFQRQALKSKL